MRLLKVLLTIVAALVAMIAGVFALTVVVITGLVAPLFRRPQTGGRPPGPARSRPSPAPPASSRAPAHDAIDVLATEVVDTAEPAAAPRH